MTWEIVKPGTHIDFIGKRRIAAAVSVSLILAGLIAIPGTLSEQAGQI